MATILKNTINENCNCKNPDVKIEGDCQPPVIDVSTDDALNNYEKLINKPSINGNVLIGDKTGEELGLVDAEEGKGLSTNDFTDEYKDKLEHIEPMAQRNVQSDWEQTNTTLDDYIKNKPTKVSAFENDADYDTQTGVRAKISQHNVSSDAHLDIRQAVVNETNRATYAETVIANYINGEAEARIAGDTALQTKINTERDTRILGDTILQDNIDNEAVLRRDADQRLQTNIDAEASLRQSGDALIQSNLNTEILNRIAADSVLQNQIDTYDSRIAAEVLAREQGDAVLTQNLNTEIGLREAGDTLLQQRIVAEENARIAEDDSLANRIVAETTRATGVEGSLSNLTTTAKNNLVAAINELDSTKQDTITGAASTIVSNDLTANKVVVTNNSGKIGASTVTTTELGYLTGATSNIQTQLNNKVNKNNDIVAGTKCKITYDSKGLVTAGADLAESDIPGIHLNKLIDVNVTATEVNYLTGATSNIQTQINGKRDLVTGEGKVYTTDGAGNQSSLNYATSNTASTIVQRDSNSQINVAQTPTANTHATSKKYVDDKISAAISEAVVFKGIVANETLLPQSGNTNGDMYWITAFSDNPPAGMTAGRSGSAIWKVTGSTGEWNYTQDSIYEPDDETIELNANGELSVMISSVANNAITTQSDGLHVDISGKVDANSAITGATHTKITYDSKGLVTAGADLVQSDIPALNLTKITDVTATAAEVNVLDGITASTAELNILDGATLSTTELNYVDGVTSSIQTQLNNKVEKNNDITAGTHTKITYDAKGLVTAGADLTASDIPDISGKYWTVDTDQTTTGRKTITYTANGLQDSGFSVLGTEGSGSESGGYWEGRVKVGTNKKTFMFGVAKNGNNHLCGIGAHTWSDAASGTGAGWEDIYINPDGGKAIYLGGNGWTANSGWLKIQNGGTSATSNDKVYLNLGTYSTPVWKTIQPSITGGATTITDTDLTASKALISDANGKVAVSTVTSTELGYVSGVTSSIQTQLNSKAVPADIGNATITFKANGSTIAGQSFTTNASTDVEIDLGNTGLVDDVKINTTSIVSNKIATIPYASTSAYGVVELDTTKGITASNGILELIKASDAEITTKTDSYKAIVPANLDKAIVEGLSNNSLTMTEAQQSSTRDFIGATQVILRDWI